MQWSKVRSTIEQDRFAEAIQKRVRIHAAVYDQRRNCGRVWIEFDQDQVVSFCDHSTRYEHRCGYNTSSQVRLLSHQSPPDETRTEGLLIEKGEFSKKDAFKVLFDYLHLSIDEALAQPSPIVNGFAILDRRIGKRRLKELKDSYSHPLVKALYRIRIECEAKA